MCSAEKAAVDPVRDNIRKILKCSLKNSSYIYTIETNRLIFGIGYHLELGTVKKTQT